MLNETLLSMDEEGFSDKEVRDIQEGNLIPNGTYVFEIMGVEFDNVEHAYTPRDQNKEVTGPPIEYSAEQHISGKVQFRVADGVNNSQVNRRITEFMRFFNRSVPGLIESLPYNMRQMHDATMGKIVALVNASQAPVLVNASGNKQYLTTFFTDMVTDPPRLIRATVGKKADQNGVMQNTIGGFKPYKG